MWMRIDVRNVNWHLFLLHRKFRYFADDTDLLKIKFERTVTGAKSIFFVLGPRHRSQTAPNKALHLLGAASKTEFVKILDIQY